MNAIEQQILRIRDIGKYFRTEVLIKLELGADGPIWSVDASEIDRDRGSRIHESHSLSLALDALEADAVHIAKGGRPYVDGDGKEVNDDI